MNDLYKNIYALVINQIAGYSSGRFNECRNRATGLQSLPEIYTPERNLHRNSSAQGLFSGLAGIDIHQKILFRIIENIKILIVVSPLHIN